MINKILHWPVKKWTWMAMLVCPFIIACALSVIFCITAFKYFSLQNETFASEYSAIVVQKGEDKFYLQVQYLFEFNQKKYRGQQVLPVQYFNKFSADRALQSYKKQTPKIYFKKANPKNNCIHKAFPTKTLTYLVSSLAVFIYFVFLKYYSEKQYL